MDNGDLLVTDGMWVATGVKPVIEINAHSNNAKGNDFLMEIGFVLRVWVKKYRAKNILFFIYHVVRDHLFFFCADNRLFRLFTGFNPLLLYYPNIYVNFCKPLINTCNGNFIASGYFCYDPDAIEPGICMVNGGSSFVNS